MNFMAKMLLLADEVSTTAADGATQGGSNWQAMLLQFAPLVLIVVLMYFMLIRPQRKKQKEEQQMRDSIEVGDEITTNGGIVGRVVTVKDDSIIIETGADRNKIKIMRWAISTNNTANEKLEAERAAAKEAQEAEKAARMEEAKAKSKASRKKSKKNKDTDAE